MGFLSGESHTFSEGLAFAEICSLFGIAVLWLKTGPQNECCEYIPHAEMLRVGSLKADWAMKAALSPTDQR